MKFYLLQRDIKLIRFYVPGRAMEWFNSMKTNFSLDYLKKRKLLLQKLNFLVFAALLQSRDQKFQKCLSIRVGGQPARRQTWSFCKTHCKFCWSFKVLTYQTFLWGRFFLEGIFYRTVQKWKYHLRCSHHLKV